MSDLDIAALQRRLIQFPRPSPTTAR